MIKAYKYRLYPTKNQCELIDKHIGCARYVYNYGLAKKVASWQTKKVSLSRFDIQADLPKMKKCEETSFLKEVNAQSLQASLEDLDRAYTNFFKNKKGFPKFKTKKNTNQTYRLPQDVKIDFERNLISLPKFREGISIVLSRTFEGKIKSTTIRKTITGKYFACILVEVNESYPNPKPIDENQAIGIDLGIKTFATLSNGIEIENPKFLRKSLRKLKRLQRRHSKKQKDSANREKSRIKLALLHEKITNKRSDFLHKVTTKLTNEYSTICLETLKVSKMLKNHYVAQGLVDVAITTFNKQIEYKAKEKGVNIIRIGQFEPSSRLCTCGVVNKNLKLSERIWKCHSCGTVHQRDQLAANNIKRMAFHSLNKNTEGHSEINACGNMNLQ